jgi:hypothetical protein
MPLSVPSRVWRHERVGRVRLPLECGMATGASEEPRAAYPGRGEAVALPS